MNRRMLRSSGIAASWLVLNVICMVAHSQASPECPPIKPIPAGANVTVTMRNGDIVQGSVFSSDSASITLDSPSFDRLKINVCRVRNIEEALSAKAPATGSIASPAAVFASPVPPPSLQLWGLESFTVSMGFTGSASRDETYSAAPTFYAFEPKAKGRTLLSLSASYDDKWKAAANSSNVTQVDVGKLQQLFTVGNSGAVVISGNAYRNNSQGIIVDQAYGVGGAKTFAVPQGKNSYMETDFDIRAIHDEMKAPGPTVLLVGGNLNISYSKCFPGAGMGSFCQTSQAPGQTALSSSIDFKAGVVPVFNRSKSWQAYGTFDAFHPLSAAWSVGLKATDNYFEIAPKGFNKNYINVAMSIKYAPTPAKSTK
jgi:hypothetical protein